MQDDIDDHHFLARERNRFVGYVRNLLGDAADMDAEDVVQEVLARMLERTDLPAIEALAAYIYRSLRNRVIDLGRTRRPTLSLDTAAIANTDGSDADDGVRLIDVLASATGGPLDALQSERGRATLFRALDNLRPIERDVVIAHELDGMPFRELAAAWNVPLNTLLSHKSRAMKKLGAWYRNNGTTAMRPNNNSQDQGANQ